MVKYFTTDAFNALASKIPDNVSLYSNSSPFAEEAVNHLPNHGVAETERYSPEFPELEDLGQNGHETRETDFHNAVALHKSLVLAAGMPFSFLSDKRFVVYMTHVQYWKHTIKRWPIDQTKDAKKLTERIRTRYFPLREKLSRNEFLRLIWVPFITYDPTNENDPYHLTRLAFRYNSTVDRLLDRSFSRSQSLFHYVLAAIEKSPDFQKINAKEKYNKLFGTWLNNLLGIKYLDSLTQEEVEEIVSAKIQDFLRQIG